MSILAGLLVFDVFSYFRQLALDSAYFSTLSSNPQYASAAPNPFSSLPPDL